MKTSVASVTFRRKSVCEVAELARRAGLDAVEWGGVLLFRKNEKTFQKE